MKVYVYRNLNKGGFSVVHRQIVVKVVDSIILKNVELRVRPGGKQKARIQGQRNVHAFCIGTEVGEMDQTDLVEVTYIPFVHDSFVIKDSQAPIFTSALAILKDSKLYVPRPG